MKTNKIIYRSGCANLGRFDLFIAKKHIDFEFGDYADIYYVQGKEACVIKPHKSIFDDLIGVYKDLDRRNIHVNSVYKRKNGYTFHLNDERFKTVVGAASVYSVLIDNEHKAIIIKYYKD